jgi:L-iditol 2-dehydrogenase
MGHAHIGFTCTVVWRSTAPFLLGRTYLAGWAEPGSAAFTDTVGIVLWAFERAGGVRGGECVAIVGPGAMGLLAVQIARALGAGLVIVIGIQADSHRLELARQMGAHEIILAREGVDPVQAVRDLTSGRGADLVIEFAGSSEASRQSLEVARRGGRVVLAGATSPGRQLNVDLSTIVRGHLDVYGSVTNPRGISARANQLMQAGLVDIAPLITHHLPLSDFSRAWQIFTNREEDAIRVLMHP